MSTLPKGKVVCGNFVKRPVRITSNTKASMSSLHCICTDGTTMPPSVLFPGKMFPFDIAAKFPSSYFVGVTQNGWMEKDLFFGWMKLYFVPNLRPMRPVLLIVDGNRSHIDLRTLQLCKDENIELYQLHEHASHLIQPCDMQYFKDFKASWRKAIFYLYCLVRLKCYRKTQQLLFNSKETSPLVLVLISK